MAAYEEKFKVGTKVRVAGDAILRQFLRPAWKFHHPLEPDLIRLAGSTQVVESVGVYHGGDVLYRLRGIDATWHERALVGGETP